MENITLEQSINEFLEFSISTFKEATEWTSLKKLQSEQDELFFSLKLGDKLSAREEYVDCIMCLFDSAKRAGISPEDIIQGFKDKTKINKAKEWIKNQNNDY